MDCFFINDLNLPFNDRVRRGDIYDRFIDEYFVPADFVCIAGGISEFGEVSASFLIRLSQKYRGVFYVYGGCDMNSDIPLSDKFELIKNRTRYIQKNKCTPARLDGNVVERYGYRIGGAMGFDMQEKISSWNWWTDDKKDIFNDETVRLSDVVESMPNIVISRYRPECMNLVSENIDIWHYGISSAKELSEKNGKILLTNSCHVNVAKFTKEDFLLKL